MRRATPLVLIPTLGVAFLCGWAIAAGALGLAKTVLVGFGALTTLVVAALLVELGRDTRRRTIPARRRSRTAHP